MDRKAQYFLAAARIALGWTFLWAFTDKLLGLGFATEPQNAWIRGGSPTFGFLTSHRAVPSQVSTRASPGIRSSMCSSCSAYQGSASLSCLGSV
jgi:hypothetical protein